MTTKQPLRSTTLQRGLARVRDFITRLTAPAQDKGELWQLYRLARGSDSMRPALVRKLAATVARP